MPITLSAPLTQAHAAGTTVNGPATGLISDSPQGQIIGVLNNDQDGLNYPAHKWGTGYYMSNLLDGQAGPWFNNINATPISPAPNNVYGTVGIQRLQHNLAGRAGVPRLRCRRRDAGRSWIWARSTTSASRWRTRSCSRTRARCRTTRRSSRCRRTCRRTRRSTRRCSTTGPAAPTRCRSASAASRRSATSASTTRAPTRSWAAPTTRTRPAYPSKPTLAGEFGQDSNSDYFSNLNYWASGTVHGPGRLRPAVRGAAARRRVRRDVVLLRASPRRRRAARCRSRTARSRTSRRRPKKPTAQTTVIFDAGFSRTKDGKTKNLTYYWDFGDGSPVVSTTEPTIQHTFPTQAAWRDVKLVVAPRKLDASGRRSFRQEEPIDFFPTYYPAVAPGLGAAAAVDRRGSRPVRRAVGRRAGGAHQGGRPGEAVEGEGPDRGRARERRRSSRTRSSV